MNILNYNSKYKYTLNGVFNTEVPAADSQLAVTDYPDLSTRENVNNIVSAAIAAQTTDRQALNANAVNFAYFILRTAIQEAAEQGLTEVILEWSTLTSTLVDSTSTTQTLIENFLGLTINQETGKYNDWTPPGMFTAGEIVETQEEIDETGDILANNWVDTSPWGIIVKEITNQFTISYLYQTNEQIPYAVRIGWKGVLTKTNTIDKEEDPESPKFLVAPYYGVLGTKTIADDTAKDILTEVSAQMVYLTQYVNICNHYIKTAAETGNYFAILPWEAFGAYKDDIIRYFFTSTNINDFALKPITISNDEGFVIYENSVDHDSPIHKFNKNDVVNAKTLLQACKYDVVSNSDQTVTPKDRLFEPALLLKNLSTNTYDGFAIYWGEDPSKTPRDSSSINDGYENAVAYCLAYVLDHKVNLNAENVYVSLPTADNMELLRKRTSRAMNAKHLQTIANLIYAGLTSAFSAEKHVMFFLWDDIDASLPESVKTKWYRDNIEFTGPIIPTDPITGSPVLNNENEPITIGTLHNSTDDHYYDIDNGYLTAISEITKGKFIYIPHNITIKNSKATVSAAVTKDGKTGYKQVIYSYKKDSDGNFLDNNDQITTDENKFVIVATESVEPLKSNEYYWDFLFYKDAYSVTTKKDGKTTSQLLFESSSTREDAYRLIDYTTGQTIRTQQQYDASTQPTIRVSQSSMALYVPIKKELNPGSWSTITSSSYQQTASAAYRAAGGNVVHAGYAHISIPQVTVSVSRTGRTSTPVVTSPEPADPTDPWDDLEAFCKSSCGIVIQCASAENSQPKDEMAAIIESFANKANPKTTSSSSKTTSTSGITIAVDRANQNYSIYQTS